MIFGRYPEKVPIEKRCFDLVLTIPGLLLLSPIFLLVGLLVWISIGWPILFSQVRPGFHARLFRLYKFRTMNNRRDSLGNLLPDAQRMTRLGNFLRAASLDELPELFNVLQGEMSLVGPRPLLPQYLGRYSDEQARRHHVLPGITGWAQIHGRNALDWQEKFRLDVWYVDHWSFWVDIRILALTVWKVLIREGISMPGQATAEEFMGNQPKDI
jgi:lipopolysaccharide/colanic/teichoic acid biosynthesis glycosyltransferase